jgi:HAD superfamily hydrolase (TIGR01509 family)
MVKVVVFDLGKVLVDFDYGIAARNVAARGNVTGEELMRVMAQSPLLLEYERGRLTNQQFYQEICAASGFSGDIEEFATFFADIFTPIEPMVELHAALRRQRMPTYIFSNTNDFAVRQIRRRFPFFSAFDGYILSYEHGALKPEAKLYEVVERKTGRRGPEILYLDDRPENIAAGAARAWQVILHENPEESRAAMNRLGVLNHQ